MSIAALARPEILRLKPYQAAAQVERTIRLNANEAPWTSAADTFARPLNRYPEIRPTGLRAALARRFGCTPERLLVTRGSSEAIDLLMRIFCRAGRDNIVTVQPTFSMYAHYAAIQGAAVREVESRREDDYAVLAAPVIDACDVDSRLIFLCSPNNPTARSVPAETVIEILENRRGRSAVVVDEAYVEFSAQQSLTRLLDDYDNLIVLRTLSKALAFAGARCGAAIAAADVVELLDAVQAPYALSTPVVECIEHALRAQWPAEARARIADILRERDRLTRAVAEFPFVRRLWPSDANFFLMSVGNIDELLARTREDGVLLRYFGGRLADCVRISVGSRRENDRLLDSLARVA